MWLITLQRCLAITAAGAVVASAAVGPAAAGPLDSRFDQSQAFDFAPLQTINNIAIQCPDQWKYLVNQNLAPGRLVPNGVSIEQPNGGDWVASTGQKIVMGYLVAGQDPYVAGVQSLSLTNWKTENNRAIVHLTCSNKKEDSYE